MKSIVLIYLLFCGPLIWGQIENTWIKKSNFIGGKRERGVAFSIGNYGYVGTGTDTAEVVLKDFWKYDPSDDSWSQIADLTGSERRNAVAFSIGNKGYVGTGMSSHFSIDGERLLDFWSYTPETNTWDSLAPFPGNQSSGVYFATGFSVAGKGYICGGKTGVSAYSQELWEYKPSNNQWFQRASFPTGVRYLLSSFALGSYGYVGFGATQDVYMRDLHRYDPGSNSWEQMPSLPGNVRGSAATFVAQGKGYICGGSDGGLLDDLWEFDPINESWAIRAYYGGSERKNAVAFSINDVGYLGLGKGYSGKKESVYAYVPFSYVGIQSEEKPSFTIQPNPGRQDIALNNLPQNFSSISCINSMGELIFKTNDVLASDAFAKLPSGSYLIQVSPQHGGAPIIQKLIIQ